MSRVKALASWVSEEGPLPSLQMDVFCCALTWWGQGGKRVRGLSRVFLIGTLVPFLRAPFS